jgi:homoserine O-succinyltransferase
VTAAPEPGPEGAEEGCGTGGRRSQQPELVIGLVNNMPDSALASTERQFCSLLYETGRGVEVRFFAVPGVPRGDAARLQMAGRYRSTEDLSPGEVDGLIVTGTEPRSARLEDEPYWDGMTDLIKWAEDNTPSTIWSCLAAQAAVQHIDGIRRRRFDSKLCGLLESQRASDHPLTADMPSRWRAPHSRHNDLPADDLVRSGYRVLWRSRLGGADIFAKQRRSLFVLFQNHPEYDHGALGREYRRDVERFLTGVASFYPNMPHDYFDGATKAAMLEFQARAVHAPSKELFAEFPSLGANPADRSDWYAPAARTFANWLDFIAASRRDRKAPVAAFRGSGERALRA